MENDFDNWAKRIGKLEVTKLDFEWWEQELLDSYWSGPTRIIRRSFFRRFWNRGFGR